MLRQLGQWCAFFLLSSSAIIAYQLPDFSSQNNLLEKKMGVDFVRVIWRSGLVNEDIESTLYLRNLGKKLLAKKTDNERHFDFFLLNSNQINAFAGYYGYIGVFSGLITAADSEAELASVMAHEIAHITQNHLSRYQSNTGNHYYWSIAALLATIVASSSGNAEVAEAIAYSSVGGLSQRSVNFIREHEREADRVGMQLLVDGGFSAQGMPDFFTKLLAQSEQQSLEFLRTHPLTINRIAESQKLADQYQGGQKTSLPFAITRAKLRYQVDKKTDFDSNDPQVKAYMNAWLALEQNQTNLALHADKLRKVSQHNMPTIVAILLARIDAQLGRFDKAIQDLIGQDLVGQDLNNEAVVYYLASIYKKANKTKKGIDLLKTFLRQNEGQLFSHLLLADLYLADKQIARFHLTMADVLQKKATFLSAKQQLLQAEKQTFDPYLKARISAKLIDIDKLIKQFGDEV